MKTYCGIDLHSNNNVIVVIDENDKILLERKLSNNLGVVLDALSAIREPISGIAVESTYNWYWLVRINIDLIKRFDLNKTTSLFRFSFIFGCANQWGHSIDIRTEGLLLTLSAAEVLRDNGAPALSVMVTSK